MSGRTLSSMDRVLTALDHREPDMVPLMLAVTMHGATELGLTIREYFSRPENVVEGQLRMRAKYDNDCINATFYAAVDYEAFGGEVLFFEDGPPNSGEPLISRREDILKLEPPVVRDTECLTTVLTAIEMLKERVGDDAPILGCAVSPFSLPVMQMGYGAYIELMYESPELFWRLMEVNEEFCVEWANAQLKVGATAVAYFDPVSSTTSIPREMFLKTGFEVAKKTMARIKGPTAYHLASGRCLGILDDIALTGTAAIGVSALEDLSLIKAACRGKLAVIGNLNAIEMRRWSAREAEEAVKTAIAKAGAGGGYVLSDNHGEIPFQVTEETLMEVSTAARKWGRYPLDWIDEHAG